MIKVIGTLVLVIVVAVIITLAYKAGERAMKKRRLNKINKN